MLVTLFKDRYNQTELAKLVLNERQIKAILYIKEHGSINNSKYVEVIGVSRQTATRDLKELVESYHVLKAGGKGGSGTTYTLD